MYFIESRLKFKTNTICHPASKYYLLLVRLKLKLWKKALFLNLSNCVIFRLLF
jgi:hypothetical protein